MCAPKPVEARELSGSTRILPLDVVPGIPQSREIVFAAKSRVTGRGFTENANPHIKAAFYGATIAVALAFSRSHPCLARFNIQAIAHSVVQSRDPNVAIRAFDDVAEIDPAHAASVLRPRLARGGFPTDDATVFHSVDSDGMPRMPTALADLDHSPKEGAMRRADQIQWLNQRANVRIFRPVRKDPVTHPLHPAELRRPEEQTVP